VFWARVFRPIHVVVAKIPCLTRLDRLPTPGALHHPGGNQRLQPLPQCLMARAVPPESRGKTRRAHRRPLEITGGAPCCQDRRHELVGGVSPTAWGQGESLSKKRGCPGRRARRAGAGVSPAGSGAPRHLAHTSGFDSVSGERLAGGCIIGGRKCSCSRSVVRACGSFLGMTETIHTLFYAYRERQKRRIRSPARRTSAYAERRVARRTRCWPVAASSDLCIPSIWLAARVPTFPLHASQ
jgi:hypothetical protein